ncbi:MAG TPA: protein disulfide isomerase family protein [Candidatus Nanoarchaeia archaeon]|nr:protein disulfide isomerase family protein [Candidatus Nanoarchaeia archaeon]
MKLVIFSFFILGIVFISGCSPKQGQYDTFAQCLTEKGTVMYGTDWCPHCKDQKAMFGPSFEYIDYVNCDFNRERCVAAGVQGYPTWIIEGLSYPGTQQLTRLASLSGCTLTIDQ